MSSGGYGMTGGTAAMGGSLRQMPSSRKGMPVRRDLATGKRTVQTNRPRGPFDIVGGANDGRIGIANRQRPLGAAAPSRQQNTQVFDLGGMLVNGSSREQKVPLGGGAETDAKRRRIAQLASQGQSAPQVGVCTPRLNSLSKDQEGLVQLAGMPNHASIDSDFYRGIAPDTRAAGSGNMIWGGMPLVPDTPFDNNYQNQGPGGAVYPGTSSDNLFIDLGDRGQASRVQNNPLMGASFNASATAKMETKSLSGAPNALVPYTHRVSDATQEWIPEEQRFMLWFVMAKAKTSPDTRLNGFETRFAPLPFHDGFNLTVLNLMLARTQKMPTDLDKVCSPEDVLKCYSLAGPVRVDVGAKLSPLGSHPGSRKNRNIVFEAQGPGDIFNLWDNPKYGQDLYLILKGKPLHEIRAAPGSPAGSYNVEAEHPAHHELLPDDVSSVPLQMVPWNDPTGYREPSLADLAYTDPFGIERYGIAIRIGRMLQRFPETCDELTRRTAPFSVHNTMRCGRVRVYVDIHRML